MIPGNSEYHVPLRQRRNTKEGQGVTARNKTGLFSKSQKRFRRFDLGDENVITVLIGLRQLNCQYIHDSMTCLFAVLEPYTPNSHTHI